MFTRLYHTSIVHHSSLKKQGVKLCKLISPSNKKKWHPTFTEANTLPSVKSLTKVKHEPGKRGIRRVAMLNKLFMKSITDLMSTGSNSIEIVGRGIEISKVTITPDLQRVNVFWVCKGNNTDAETESVLFKISGPLRHELSKLRVMGEVPKIVFVKDRHEARIIDMDRRLAVADYGDDYTPTNVGDLLRSEFSLNTKLSPEIKAKIQRLEDESPILEEAIPEMTNTVFGLDHAKMMSRILAARKKSKDAWERIDEQDNVISYRAPETATSCTDIGQQKQQLAEFLEKRQIEQNKLYKQMRDRTNWRALLVQAAENDDDERHHAHDDHALYDDDGDDEDFYPEDHRFNTMERKDEQKSSSNT